MKQVELVKTTKEDLDELHAMQVKAFMPLYEIYHDEMSPVNESKDRILWKITEENSHFYYIIFDGKKVGAVRAVRDRSLNDDSVMWISPIFILPEFQDLKIGAAAVERLFEMWDDKTTWKLSTIKQEERNRHFYEKLGFELLDWEEKINDKMDLVMYERKGKKEN